MSKSSLNQNTFLILKFKKCWEEPVFSEDSPFSQGTLRIEEAAQAEGEKQADGAEVTNLWRFFRIVMDSPCSPGLGKGNMSVGCP